MAQSLSLAAQTMFAELTQRCLDARFEADLRPGASIRKKKQRNRYYWYQTWREGGTVKTQYIGPVTDPAITARVQRFQEIREDVGQRREMVRALIAAGLPQPDRVSGDVVDALGRAGFFRLRGVLVGTVAYQAYSGLLGVRLPGAALMTQDADFAQFWGVSQAIGESVPPILQILHEVDDTFRPLPSLENPFLSTRFQSARGYRVEFLTANRGSDDHQARPAQMPALGGASAQPLRYLDYLIHQPEQSVLLHRAGVSVSLPRAERYAVHKLIVSAAREDQAKARKDTLQASALIRILSSVRPIELAQAWEDAWSVGPRWRERLDAGRARLDRDVDLLLESVCERATASRSRRSKPKP